MENITEKEKTGLDSAESATIGTTQTICTRCCMDISAKEITFDQNGVCNFCHQAQSELKSLLKTENKLSILIDKIKKESKEKYDILIGLSGGVDSSRMLYQCFMSGLKPLCFSVDNGWNDPVADENIMKLVEGMKVPFYRYNIDLEKFRELQSAFLKAGVKNVEIPTDHILMAVSYELAAKYGIKYIASGGNVATESIMPPSWGHNARDLTHIKAIYNKFTGKRLKGLPTCSIWRWNWYRWVKGIKIVYPLDSMIIYNREEAIKVLEKNFDYKHPGEKHEESVWTKWFQNYYLFEKFGIDKRKAHYSSLINSGQMTREEAFAKLAQNPVYPELGIEKQIMSYPRHEHSDYPMDKWYSRIAKVVKIFS